MTNQQPNRASPIPVYRQIADVLRAEIEGGLQPGDKIASERKLADRFDVSVLTVRQAIALLRSEGLLESQQGKGVFVRSRPPILRSDSRRLSRAERAKGAGAFMTDAKQGGFRAQPETEVREEVATPRIAEILGVNPGDVVLVRDRLMLADGRPAQLATSYLPKDVTAGTLIEQADTGPGGTYARLEEAGHTLTEFEERIRVRMPTPEESVALHLGAGVPVILVTRLAYSGERVVEVNEMVMAGDRYELVHHIPAT